MIHKTARELQILRLLGEKQLRAENTKENLRPQNEAGEDSEKLRHLKEPGENQKKRKPYAH